MIKRWSKKLMLSAAGIICLLSGLAMVLVWWKDVVILARGAGGMILAVSGMILLYLIKEVND